MGDTPPGNLDRQMNGEEGRYVNIPQKGGLDREGTGCNLDVQGEQDTLVEGFRKVVGDVVESHRTGLR